MSRIYGNIEEVDSEKIKKFFNNRAKKDEEALLVKTEFSDKENVEKRHKEESELLLNKIDFAASSNVKVEIEPGRLTDLTKKSIEPYKLNDLQEYMEKNKDEKVKFAFLGHCNGSLTVGARICKDIYRGQRRYHYQ